MPHYMFSYETKKISKNYALVDSIILSWIVKLLKKTYTGNYLDTGIDILLNHLPFKTVEDIYQMTITTAIKRKETSYRKLKDSFAMKSFNAEHYNYIISFLVDHWPGRNIDNIKQFIFNEIEKLINKKDKLIKKDKIHLKLKTLKSTFNLSDYEIKLLLFCFISTINSDIEMIFIERNRYRNEIDKRLDIIAKVLEISPVNLLKILHTESPLIKYDLINRDFTLQMNITNFLLGLDDSPFLSTFYKKFEGSCIPLEAQTLRIHDSEIIKTIIKNKKKNETVNILLYGEPGSGKTEYVRSLASDLNKNLYEILCEKNNNVQNNYHSEKFNRFTAFYACQNTIPTDKSIILIDEADELLNGQSLSDIFFLFNGSLKNKRKNKVNELLDNSFSVNFWITNSFDKIDPSTKRRFDYSIKFTKFDFSQRLSVWKSAIKKYNLIKQFDEDDIRFLAEKYEINAGGIDTVLKNYKRVSRKKFDKKTITSLITPYIKLMGEGQNTTDISYVKNYSLKDLNIKGSLKITDALDIITEFNEFMKTNEYTESDVNNMNILLYGPPGTGKTEFVKFMSKKLGRTLLIKQGSSFLNKFVGETERNINLAFNEAEQQNAILFIDEADGLFFERKKSVRSFETTMVNELLVQMENFHGIFVCSTNFHKNMDAAVFRRFNLKFEFDYLTNEGKYNFYNMYFSDLISAPFGENERTELNQMHGLTPGDFKVVRQKFFFYKNKKLDNSVILNALNDELKYKDIKKTNKVGFDS